ncbi:MAG: ammonium transporter [Candidatus Glassbacteria bacterium]|nr:ammonium transporter [Candidatus Glassbacteria bacterium]
MSRIRPVALAASWLLFAGPGLVYAADNGPTVAELVRGINTVWVLVAAFLVFFMQAGFGMLEAGFTRAKNAANILTKNMMDFSMASLAYWMVGFGLMYGAGNGLLGTDQFFLIGSPAETAGVPTYAFWLFQAVFTAAAATIVAGAMAERTKFKTYMIYSFIISALIYPIVGHWIWGGGWLSELGFQDFAGSTVVHSVGGFAAMAGAIVLGPRLGKYNPDGSANVIPGHNIPLAALGCLILWFGWFGFNPGSSLSGMDAHLIAKVAVNTNLSASAGCVATTLLVWWRYGKPDLSMSINGALAGLVAITAPCAVVSPASSVLIGFLAAPVVTFGVSFLDRIHVDDPVGAIPVHGMCGAWGTVALGLFHESDGLFFGGGFKLVGVQALGSLTVILFTLVSMYIIFKLLAATVGLRVSQQEEIRGLDIGEHGMESYAGFQIFLTD